MFSDTVVSVIKVAKVPEISQTMSGHSRKRPGETVTLFKCDICLCDNFKSMGGLRSHRTKIHPNAPQVQQHSQQHKRRRSGEVVDTQQNAAEGTSVIAHDVPEEDRAGGEASETVEPIEMEEEGDADQDGGTPANDLLAEENAVRTDDSNRIKWGEYEGVEAIRVALEAAHLRITTWQKNTFDLPKNAIGKAVLTEATRLLKLFNSRTPWEPVAIHLFIIFLPLMLQKPSAKSKNKDHVRYLKKRLDQWKEGRLSEIVSECEEIQKRMKRSKKKEESVQRGFTRLMMVGKVKQALKLVDADNDVTGVKKIDRDVKINLQSKHPPGEQTHPIALAEGEIVNIEEVMFEGIDVCAVQAAAKYTTGSGGPTRLDADTWKHILCSKAFGRLSDELAEEIAVLARRMCTENIPNEHLKLLWDCRLVPLIKEDNGLRPVGVGETIRRIIGKCVLKIVGDDVKQAAGTIQTCAGLESGIEAAIHAMGRAYNDDSSEAVILVDADNAFNRLNRKVALHNIERKCPSIYKYLYNSYKAPARLHLGDGTFIKSEEGVTQGDNVAMAMYSIATRGIIESLKSAARGVKQVWFADDSAGAGTLDDLKIWWDHLKNCGPAYGYFPKAVKTHLIVKSPELYVKAEEIFGREGVKVTKDGARHIGAVIGSKDYKEQYVNNKIK